MKAGALPTDLSSLVNQAINDGASIVNFSASSSMRGADLKWAIARAMSQELLQHRLETVEQTKRKPVQVVWRRRGLCY